MKKFVWFVLLIAAAVVLFLFVPSCKRQKNIHNEKGETVDMNYLLDWDKLETMVENYSDSLDTEAVFPDAHNKEYLSEQLRRFYKGIDYELAWSTLDGLKPQADDYISAVKEAGEDGLDSSDYHLQALNDLKKEAFPDNSSINIDKLIELDFMLTASCLKYASHLFSGRVDLQANGWHTKAASKDLAFHLFEAIDKNTIHKSLDDLLPKHHFYINLKKSLAKYNEIHRKGGWQVIPVTEAAPGDSSGTVYLLRKRLEATGELSPADSATAYKFDNHLEKALKNYQESVGIEPSGKLNKATIAALNIPVEERLSQIKLNLERLRWLPEKSGERFLMVNIPETKLRIFNNGQKEVEMDIIVGKTGTPTPVFSDTMEHVIFSPTWGVPYSIASKEMLPDIQRNPGYLTRSNYVLYKGGKQVDPHSVDWSSVTASNFKYQIVQRPGRGNALGTVKFMFPNRFNVYLHDTNQQSLFNRNRRYFSHGCIRVSEPGYLAEYLLKSTNKWSPEKIEQARASGKTQQVNLPEKLPVHIYYLTAWADDSGRVNFRGDIYGFDKKHLALLNENPVEV